MSLQVWLTGNNTMNNQGLLGNLTQTTAPSYVDGKLGKAMSTGGYKMTAEQTAQVLNNEAISICFWVYINVTTGSTDNRINLFGNNSMEANNNRKFALYNYPTVNDLHWSWMNDTANNTFASGILSGVLPSYQWTHVAVTYQNPNGTIYINGEKVRTFTGVSNSSTFAYETQVIHNSSGLKWNDYRIYNSCISAKEVKQISQGLVCHYKLSGVGGENLVSNSPIEYTAKSCDMYRFSVGSQKTLTDWGLTVGDIITLSFYVKTDSGKKVRARIEFYNSGSDRISVYGDNYVQNGEGFVYVTTTVKSGYEQIGLWADVNLTMSEITDTTTEYYKLVKLEKGSKPTPWCPNPSDTLYSTLGYNDVTEYDCSGYGNNGTKVGDIAWTGDSARYSGSYYFSTKSHYKIPCPLVSPQEFSCSFWVKPVSCGGYAIISSNYNSPNSGFWLAVNCEGSGLWFFNGNYARSNKGLLSLNTWYHVCFIFNKGIITWYQNGEVAGTTDLSSKTTTLGIKDYISIGNSFTGTAWNTNYSGNISDFRIYSTILSAEDVKSLYNTSASINKTGVLFCGEIMEGE